MTTLLTLDASVVTSGASHNYCPRLELFVGDKRLIQGTRVVCDVSRMRLTTLRAFNRFRSKWL